MSTASQASSSPARHKKRWSLDIHADMMRPIHGSCSRYGRKRKLASLPDFCVLDRNGQYTDLFHSDDPDTPVTSKKGPSAAAMDPSCTELNHSTVKEPIYDELSNEENMPLEDKIFIDTDLFRADAPPSLKTYKRKYQPLSPVAVLNTLPKQASKGEVHIKQEPEVKIKQEPEVKIKQEPEVNIKQASKLVVRKPSIKAALASNKIQPRVQTVQKEGPDDLPQSPAEIKTEMTIQEDMEVNKEQLKHDENLNHENAFDSEQLKQDLVKQESPADAEEMPRSPSAQEQLSMRCSVHLQEWSPEAADVKQPPRERPKFRVGDLLWARMNGNASYWPALVTREQENMDFFRRAPDSGLKANNLFHVSFYGSKSVNCAAWVTERNILPYMGSANLDFSETRYCQNIGPKASRITVCRQTNATELADHALQISGMERVHSFVAGLEDLRNQLAEKKRQSKARKAELSIKSEAGFESEMQLSTIKTESSGEGDFLVVKTGRYKKLRLSPPSQQKAVVKEEAHKDAPKKRGPPQSKLIQNIVYGKRRLAGVPSSKLCEKCLQPGKATVSCGKCRRALHKACAKALKGGYVCGQCGDGMACGLCNEAGQKEAKLLKCTNRGCSRQFHADCLKGWHQAKHNYNDSLICPYHTCHTCVSDDPGSQRLFVPAEHLVRCIYCPTAYHTADACIPAAALVLSSTQCVCPKHPNTLQKRKPLLAYTTNWCFACTNGGVLAVCDTCPVTYHPGCLERTSAANASNHCAECESGCFPVSGQVVWAKHSNYRWWPARIAFPDEVPHMYELAEHNYNEFIVQFLGSYDLAWSSNKRVFPYIPEDTKSEQRKKLTNGRYETKFQSGLKEAEELCSSSRAARKRSRHSLHQEPPTYQSIKINRIINSGIRARMQEMVRLQTEGSDRCSCSPKDLNPCGFGTGCLNRDLCVECDLDCPSGTLCQNRLFSKYQYSPVKPVLTPHCGWGLAANADIKEGDFVIEYVGDVIDEAELQVRIKKLQANHDKNFYFLAFEGQLYIDAGPRGNEARFMNHSCEPNCKVDKWIAKNEMRMGLFATKDIPENTELTFNYNLQLFGDKTQQCFCGTPSCTGFIGNKAKPKSKVQKIKPADPQPKLNSSKVKKTKKTAKC